MSLVTNCSRTFRGVLLFLVALALLACLPPTAHAQDTLTVTGTGDPSPVPSCFGLTKTAPKIATASKVGCGARLAGVPLAISAEGRGLSRRHGSVCPCSWYGRGRGRRWVATR